MEQAFAAPIASVELTSGRTAFANQAAPTLPASIAHYVQGVVGLDDLTLPQPQYVRAATHGAGSPSTTATPQVLTGGPQPCLEAQEATEFGGYTADQIAAAYGFPGLYGGSDRGAGQTVALIEFQPYAASDIATYQACYGTSSAVVPVNVDGGPEPSTDDGEAALDIEQIISLAPGAGILVYQAPNRRASGQADILSAIVSEDHAKVISDSWATCEPRTNPALLELENTLLQEAATQGQSFFASSGDTGAAGCYRSNEEETEDAVQDPSSQPFATAVGGTSLIAAGPPSAETVWNGGSPEAGATGGGTSGRWPMPAYQSAATVAGIFGPDSRLCGASYCREVPDVAADADPATGYPVRYDEEWETIGGTSASAPLWAALTALTDASPACRGRTIGFMNPALYGLSGTAYTANFHDITTASPYSEIAGNDVFGGEGPFPVTPGYDMTTGLGSPVLPTLAASLCSIASPPYTVGIVNPGAVIGKIGQPTSLQLTGTDSGGLPLTYGASGLPPGLAINPATGAIAGTPVQPGIWTVTVSASDSYTNAGGTTFVWSIGRPKTVHVSHLKLLGVAKRRPNLSFKIGVAKGSPRLAAIKVTLPHGLGLSHAPRTLRKGVRVEVKNDKRGKHERLKLHVVGGALTIKLPAPAQKATVDLHWPALRASAKLAMKAAGKKKLKLKVVIGATDTTGKGSRFALPTRAR